MQVLLDQKDVSRLMAQPSPHVRAIIANKIGLVIDQPQLTDTERLIAYDILRRLAKDIDMVVRRSVAQNLRHSQNLPHDVAMLLAEDVEAVALPILTDSMVLSDDDLIAVLQHGSPTKQKAIACRQVVSEKVSRTIISLANEIAVISLMGNNGAHINDNSFVEAINRFSNSVAVKESMVMRKSLPLGIAERLATVVSGKLQEYLVMHHELPSAFAAELIAQNHERAMIQVSQNSSLEDIEHLVSKMHEKDRLKPLLVLRALCVGNLPFFEFSMAKLAGIPVVKARTLIHGAGMEALKALCKKCQFPEFYAGIINNVLDVMEQLRLSGEDQDQKQFRVKIIEHILTQAESMDKADMDVVLDMLNQL